MEIIAPKRFEFAHKIAAKFTKYDPRIHPFPSPDVVLNLSQCTRIYPPAILWCAVCLSQWRRNGFGCILVPPRGEEVTASLIDSGLFQVLCEAGVNVYHEGASIPSPVGAILPVTPFASLTEAAELTNRVEDSLYRSGRGSANIHPLVCELFSELVNNAAEHSESSIGAYGFVQFYSSGRNRRFTCGVADGGIGIRQSIERNAGLEHFGYDWPVSGPDSCQRTGKRHVIQHPRNRPVQRLRGNAPPRKRISDSLREWASCQERRLTDTNC